MAAIELTARQVAELEDILECPFMAEAEVYSPIFTGAKLTLANFRFWDHAANSAQIPPHFTSGLARHPDIRQVPSVGRMK